MPLVDGKLEGKLDCQKESGPSLTQRPQYGTQQLLSFPLDHVGTKLSRWAPLSSLFFSSCSVEPPSLHPGPFPHDPARIMSLCLRPHVRATWFLGRGSGELRAGVQRGVRSRDMGPPGLLHSDISESPASLNEIVWF